MPFLKQNKWNKITKQKSIKLWNSPYLALPTGLLALDKLYNILFDKLTAPELCPHKLYHTNTHCRSKLRGKAIIKPMTKHEFTVFISPLVYMQIHNDCQKEKRLETLLNNHMMVQYLSCTQNILDSFAYLVSLELFSQPHWQATVCLSALGFHIRSIAQFCLSLSVAKHTHTHIH